MCFDFQNVLHIKYDNGVYSIILKCSNIAVKDLISLLKIYEFWNKNHPLVSCGFDGPLWMPVQIHYLITVTS